MRADAERNRERIMDTAHEVFTERGALAPLEAVARRAGWGSAPSIAIFPTREDLLLALVVPWTEEVELFCDEVVASAISPRTKLTRWLIEYVAGCGSIATAPQGWWVRWRTRPHRSAPSVK